MNICKKVDLISINARIYTLSDVFEFLHRDGIILSNPRSRKRKLIDYSNYITAKNDVKYFSERMGVLNKKMRHSVFGRSLINKWNKFCKYNKIDMLTVK